MKAFSVIFAWANWALAIYMHNIYSFIFVAVGFLVYFLVMNFNRP